MNSGATAAIALVLTTAIANVMFWLVWGHGGFVAMLWALAITAIVGVVAFISIRDGRWFFASIAVGAAILLYFNLVNAETGDSNEYAGIILAAPLLPIILILAVTALVQSVRRNSVPAD